MLTAATEACLRRAPGSLSELELIRQLQAPPWALIGKVDYADPTALYPVHFLLFHVLYRLRDELAEQGECLNISPLAISLTMPQTVAGTGPPDLSDPLRTFYLDLGQYRLSDQAVQRMVDDFWAGRVNTRPPAESAGAAARVLGFDDLPDDFQQIKLRFRRTMMKIHPDRGGDTAEVQALNEAFALLRHYFRSGDHP